jgi:endonuclease YncB( thermonuclease family)
MMPKDAFVRTATLLKIIDGDTMRCQIDQGFGTTIITDVRLSGCDTPEQRGPEAAAGKFVTSKVEQWFGYENEPQQIVLHSHYFKLGKFGRCLCTIWHNDQCLNEYLLEEGLAWVTDHRGVIIGIRSCDVLSLPDGIKQQVREAMA